MCIFFSVFVKKVVFVDEVMCAKCGLCHFGARQLLFVVQGGVKMRV